MAYLPSSVRFTRCEAVSPILTPQQGLHAPNHPQAPFRG
jgi:hypothetical protein